MATFEDRRSALLERMEQRAEKRSAEIDQRRAAMTRHGGQSELENAPRFMERITADTDRLKSSLDVETLRQLDTNAQNKAFEEAAVDIQQVSRRLTESTMFLPAFDVELSRDLIQQCQTRLANVRALLQPKKKFAFAGHRAKASRKAPSAPLVTSNNGESVTAAVPQKNKVLPTSLGDYGESERQNEVIDLLDCSGKDVFLSQLQDCRVRIAGGGKAVRVDHLNRCRVVCAPTAGSVFIDNCQDCVFVTACQQLRIHNTQCTNFYIHVTSKAIIEDCADVRFAPYLVQPESELRERLEAVGLNPNVNNWDKVEDFNHLAIDVASPNWTLLSEEDRDKFELI